MVGSFWFCFFFLAAANISSILSPFNRDRLSPLCYSISVYRSSVNDVSESAYNK
ncbi:hypothetical protein GCWU000282_02735 [Catonella morbi ATCC 51271]|uniref:Uncharacterized protein n=1 Tax=Catonella morbi ATCC 51271 TaxID=592026 RepID=V2Y1G8_9FIRM|nr:hypothetical protein GCWU000282_02735 [Catonella morbi ATCC 51271]